MAKLAIKLPSETGDELLDEKWSDPIRFEVAQIRAHRAVLADSVQVRVEGEGSIAILFTFRTAQVAESQCTDILPREAFGLIYARNEVGRAAPSVLSDRADFPRYLPHLNPTEKDRPASLCLSRLGLQPFYEISPSMREGVLLRYWKGWRIGSVMPKQANYPNRVGSQCQHWKMLIQAPLMHAAFRNRA